MREAYRQLGLTLRLCSLLLAVAIAIGAFGGARPAGATALVSRQPASAPTQSISAAGPQLNNASGPSARSGASMAYDAATGAVILFGGDGCQDGSCSALDDTWSWDGSNWAQSPLSPGCAYPCSFVPPAREGAAMAYEAVTSSIILFGGWDPDGSAGPLNDTWSWDGSAWSQLVSPGCISACPSSPPGRTGATMAYDAASSVVMLFGGRDPVANFYLNDTWIWNGSAWSPRLLPVCVEVCPSNPPARGDASMAYDSSTGAVILFGGATYPGSACSCFHYLDDTWSWDGSIWNQLAPASSPSARGGAGMADDGATGTAMLFGGFGGCPSSCPLLDDTWTWDGTNWTRPPSPACPSTCVSSPPARQDGSMAYDAATGTVVLFGGDGEGSDLGDTWLWNGGIWSQVGNAGAPPPTVTGISPSFGSLAGGTVVTITGAGFISPTAAGNTTVNFVPSGGSPSAANAATSVSCTSSTICMATSPPGCCEADVRVTVGGQTSAITAADQFIYVAVDPPPPPIVLSISPSAGPLSGGTVVTIAGAFFTAYGAATVNFVPPGGSLSAGNAATSVSCSYSSCTATSPPGSGTVDVRVTIAGQISTPILADQFTYFAAPSVMGLSPNTGSIAGGTSVTISGTNFSTGPGQTSVHFGGTPASKVSCSSATTCTATSPAPITASASSVVDVTVTTPGGTSATSPADQFTYQAPNSCSPNACSVSIQPSTISVAPSGSATVSLQETGPASGLGAWTIDVTYDPTVLQVTSCTPQNGSLCNTAFAGNKIRVSGGSASGLAGTQTLAGITFQAIGAQNSSSQIVPAIITFADANGVPFTPSTSNGTISIGIPPALTSLSQPASGPPSGGTVVTIFGTSFSTAAGTTTLKFGANAATNVSCSSTTQCTATSPPGSGTVDVIVTTPGSASATGAADQFTYAPSGPYAGVSIQPSVGFVTLQAQAPAAGLGSWTVNIVYNPSVIQITDCAPQHGSVCNPAFSSNTLQVTGVSATGLTGVQPLATISFASAADAAANSSTTLTPAIMTFTDPTGSPVSGTPSGITITVLKLGDINGDGVVNAVDALCVLRTVVGLPGTQFCPIPPTGNPDVNGDGQVTSVDSLCILRGVARLPAVQACLLVSGPTTSPAATSTASPASAGSGQAEGRIDLTAQDQRVAPGGSTTVQVRAGSAGDIGSWTVDVRYDPKVLRPTGCTATAGSLCNTSFAAGTVRVSGASADGLSGGQTLATITFQATATAAGSTTIHATAATLTDSNGVPESATTAETTLQIGSKPAGGPSPRAGQ